MSYVRTNEDFDAAQHHGDPSWPADERLITMCCRVFGRDPNTEDLLIADGPGGVVPDWPNTVGPEIDRAVWFASGSVDPANVVRETPYWGGAFAGVIQKPGGSTSDPYKSRVVSPATALPAFWQDPSSPAEWVADTGVLPQKVAVAGGASLPAGTPVIILPFSVTTEQQMAAFKASGELIAVWRGGKANGDMGTLVYDVTEKGELDELRRARGHSFWRVFRLPEKSPDLLPFGAVPAKTGSGPPPVSSGLAWLMSLDVDGQAGYGMISDRVKPRHQDAGAGFTGNKPVTGPGTAQLFTTGEVAAQGAEGSFDPNSGTYSGGVPLGVEGAPHTVSPADATGQHPTTQSGTGRGVPKTQGKLPEVTVLAVTSERGFGPFSVGEFPDIHEIATTPDGEKVHSTHLFTGVPWKGDGFDAPFETNGVYKPTKSGGPLWLPVEFNYDSSRQHPWLQETRPGLRRWEVSGVFDVPQKKDGKTGGRDKTGGNDKTGGVDKSFEDKFGGKDNATDKVVRDKSGGKDNSRDKTGGKDVTDGGKNPNEDKAPDDNKGHKDFSDGASKLPSYDPSKGGVDEFIDLGKTNASHFTFGGGILLESGTAPVDGKVRQSSGETDYLNRTYARTPLEVATPAILARAVSTSKSDLRGKVAFTLEQARAYDSPAPISGVFSALASQVQGGFNWFSGSQPGSGLYDGGVANAGGFVYHPANVDVRALLNGVDQPPDVPTTSLTFYRSGWAMGTPLENGLLADGYRFRLDGSEIKGDTYDSTGTVTGTGTLWPPSASQLSPCFYGDGSDGTATADGAGAVTGMTGPSANVYTVSRDVFFENLTINSGVTVKTNGYVVHVQDTFTVDAGGVLDSSGTNGGNASAVAGGTAGSGPATGTLNFGQNGGAGGAPTVNGTAGVSTTDSLGGSAGAGGAGFTGTAGAAGTATAPVASKGTLRSMPAAAVGQLMGIGGSGTSYAQGGAGGGGGGGGSGGTGGGGGGGGGGGPVIVLAKTLDNQGTIRSNGGNGGNGAGALQGGGGGGGGGGGFVVTAYGPGSTAGTIQVNGGTGGTAGGGGTVGANGSTGTVITLC